MTPSGDSSPACITLPDRVITGARLVYANDFASMDDFWREGGEDARTEGGRLFIDTALERAPGCRHAATVFCRRQFTGDILVRFEAQSTDERSHRNFNFFMHAALPGGGDLYATRDTRTGDYPEYHTFDNYLFTYLPAEDGTPRARFRLRRNPGFRLMHEAHAHTCVNFRWYTFQYLLQVGEVRTYVDDDPRAHFGWNDPAPLAGGLIGFRTFQSRLAIRALRVYAISR